MMQVANFLGLKAVQRRVPGAVRCTAPSWTSEVRMPELAAPPTAQVQAMLARQARALRLRRLTSLPYGVFWSGLRLDVPGEELIVGVECRGLRHGIAELGVAACAQASCPRLVVLAQVRDCARCPVGQRLALAWFFHDHVEGAVDDCTGKRGARLRLVAALESADDLLILLHCDEWRMVGLVVLFVRFQRVDEISGHAILQLLQTTNDLAALKWVDCRAGTL